MRMNTTHDRGSVLPLVLIVVVVMSMVVVGIARYGTANLRYSHVAEQRSDQLAAADAAMSYAVNLIRIGRADCIFDNSAAVNLPALIEDFNGSTGSVTCDTESGGLDGTPVFAIALTGEGVPANEYLIKTQSGGNKAINGPVFMERATPASFQLSNNNGIDIYDAPLVHSTNPCSSVTESTLPDDLHFIPDVFGPQCTTEDWYNYGGADNVFDEPPIGANSNADAFFSPLTNVGGSMQVRDGAAAIAETPLWPALPITDGSTDIVTVMGGYELIDGADSDTTPSCRVFRPGRYLRPPVVQTSPNTDAYFMSGDYLFDFRDANTTAPSSLASLPLANDIATEAEFHVDNTTVIAGRLDTSITTSTLTIHSDCDAAKAADTGYGVTFYVGGQSHILVEAGGAIEIMPRNQGTTSDPRYVALHALCDRAQTSWCVNSPTATAVAPSSLTAPSPPTGSTANSHNLVYSHAGQPASLVINGLIYAPKAEIELENASQDAQARFKGGMVLARATLQASASAENFEIGVTLQDIDFGFRLTATGTDQEGRSTRITAALDYTYGDPYATAVDVTSWRVCERSVC